MFHNPDLTTDYKPYVESGKITFKKRGVLTFGETSVTFEDGTSAEIDGVVLAIGYEWFTQNLVPAESEDKFRSLYLKTFDVNDTSLSYVGTVDANGMVIMIGEKQAIVVKHLIKGDFELPSKEEMLKSYEEDIGRAMHGKRSNLLWPSPDEVIRDFKEFYKLIPEGTYKGFNDAFYKKFNEGGLPYMVAIFSGNFRSFKYSKFDSIFPSEEEWTSDYF